MAAALNYAEAYSRALSQAFPNVLHFGKLYNTPMNGRYRFVNERTIEIPVLTTTGRVDANRDTISGATRNWSNEWEARTLKNQRMWKTLIHPKDIDQTNLVGTITNITKVFNEEEKFPEMDSYTSSTLYDLLKTAKAANIDTTVYTADTILAYVDSIIEKMDENNVPKTGRLLYVTTPMNTILKNAKELERQIHVDKAGSTTINRNISRIDELEIISVPTTVMKTLYDFTSGAVVDTDALQINMIAIHPYSIITPVSYSFAKLDEPGAQSDGKYVYYEESHEDVFILPNKETGIYMNTEAPAAGG